MASRFRSEDVAPASRRLSRGRPARACGKKIGSKQTRTMAIDWQAFWLTLQLAATVSAILLVLGLPIAYWIAFSRWRWKFLIEAVVALPIVLPPTVLGFYVLVALGPRSPLGRWWISLTGHTLSFTFAGLVIGSILYSLPFAVQPFAASFAGVDRKLIAASATLGASPLRTFLRVIAPLSIPGLVTGAALSFAHTMGEFGVVLMVGGNIPGVTRTVSIDIFDRVQASDYAAANATALLLLAFSFAVLAIVYGMNRKAWVIGPVK
jgi:molybdate transport system permease protein